MIGERALKRLEMKMKQESFFDFYDYCLAAAADSLRVGGDAAGSRLAGRSGGLSDGLL